MSSETIIIGGGGGDFSEITGKLNLATQVQGSLPQSAITNLIVDLLNKASEEDLSAIDGRLFAVENSALTSSSTNFAGISQLKAELKDAVMPTATLLGGIDFIVLDCNLGVHFAFTAVRQTAISITNYVVGKTIQLLISGNYTLNLSANLEKKGTTVYNGALNNLFVFDIISTTASINAFYSIIN